MDKRALTAALALALGLAWSVAPAMAQQTTTEKMKDKAEHAKDKVVDTARDVKDKVKDKASDLKDKAEDKMDRTKDKAESKTDRTMDKADSKMDRMKDKAESKMDRMKDKMRQTKRDDVMAMQRALTDKGYHPGPVDGRMGPRTKAALMDYQRKEGLTPSGKWDEPTATKLGVPMASAEGKEPAVGAVSASPPTPAAEEKAPPSKRAAP